MRKIGYNNQRDNFVVKQIPGSSQCFATSAWMLLSFYSDHYLAGDDVCLKQYITDLTLFSASSEYEWASQQKAIQAYLDKADVKGTVKLGIDLNTGKGLVTADQMKVLLTTRPVIIGTKKMAGLTGGHIILGVDNATNGILINDPFGNALTGYKDQNGESVVYSTNMFDAENPMGNIRAMWVD